MKKILIIEDDRALNKGITFNLKEEGFDVKGVYSLFEGRLEIEKDYDLIILDVNLPDGSGFDLCSEIRLKNKSTAIIFLSACDMEFDIVNGFKLGADDYITKPFSLSIMKERVQAVLRRYEGNKKTYIYKVNNLEIDFDKFILNKSGERIDITPTEFKLLRVFVNSKGKVLTRNNLLEELWDKDQNFIDEHALTVNINRLRSKIESKDDGVKYIKTIYGIGYMWIGEDA
ncbi:response regulator transcription factor [Clostridium paraputrificum]|uniref:response regulator transcription factor n=1 Tax=Clostridium paraputrificum TaxID=29363 RepID=UPI00325BB904